MIRVLFFLVLIFALGIGFAWLADRPGDLVVTFAGMRYEVSLLVAAVAVVGVVAAIMIAWWVLKSIWNSPRAVSRYFRARKRDRGYQSLSTGMIAAGAGDGQLAHNMARQASKLLNADQEPLLHLLEAQALLLDGDHAAARAKFERMLEDPETRLLGLRGLYLEAQRLKEHEVARHYAERAAQDAPQLGWASNATLEMRTAEGDWDGALGLLEKQRATKQIDKAEADRRRAVLLTAKAMAVLDADPVAAKNAASEANRLAPELVPAAVTAGQALFRLNDLRRGSKLLETAWKRDAHPDIAAAYVHARAGDSAADRLKRAKRLQSLKQNHPESMMTVARAALEAGDYGLARDEVGAVLRQQPCESAYLLLADIEEHETGDQGRIRHWLASAVRAPRDAAWTADGYVSESWAPLSPVTGRLDAFEWRVPVERLGPLLDEPEVLKRAMREETIAVPAIEASRVVEAEHEEDAPPQPERAAAAEAAKAAETAEAAEAAAPETGEAQAAEETPQQAEAAEVSEVAEATEAAEAEQAAGEGDGAKAAAAADAQDGPPRGNGGAEPAAKADKEPEGEAEEVRPPRPPDDPGVDEEEAEEKASHRFRLF